MFLISSVVYFYSVEFLIFFATVAGIFWLLPLRFRNLFLLAASYSFYASWNYKFLGLLLLSTVTDYFCGIYMYEKPERKKFFLSLSLFVNLGQLCVFKYADFFLESSDTLGRLLGFPVIPHEHLNWVLPLGISFYTFQSLSYCIDIYRNKVTPVRHFPTFALFVSFFPQLIAGPIERAAHLLPQLQAPKFLKDIDWRKGVYLFVYGVFKKRVIADFLSAFVDQIFGSTHAQGFVVLLAIISAATQIYCDVSGYADMARGIATFFGIDLTRNFHFPYFVTNPVEFWKKWHISLSMWIRHYVHTPLITRIRHANIVIYIVFILMGIWHGAHWKYIEWGIYWATVSVVYQYFLKPFVVQKTGLFKNVWAARAVMIPVMFVGQSFWRTDGFDHLVNLLSRVFINFFDIQFSPVDIVKVLVCVAVLYSYEIWLYLTDEELKITGRNFYVQTTFYVALYFLYRNIGNVAAVDFIYFHF